jgi:hypothetical protein
VGNHRDLVDAKGKWLWTTRFLDLRDEPKRADVDKENGRTRRFTVPEAHTEVANTLLDYRYQVAHVPDEEGVALSFASPEGCMSQLVPWATRCTPSTTARPRSRVQGRDLWLSLRPFWDALIEAASEEVEGCMRHLRQLVDISSIATVRRIKVRPLAAVIQTTGQQKMKPGSEPSTPRLIL